MPNYNITYACGHEGRITLTGPKRTREWLLSKKELELCPDCYKDHLAEQRAAERAAAQDAAKEQELPELIGTEKQVNWALTIRAKRLKELEGDVQSIDDLISDMDENESSVFLRAIELIQNESSASWWIEEAQKYPCMYLVSKKFEYLLEHQEKIAIEETRPAPIRPETPVSENVATIKINENEISVYYPEINDDFKEIVKSHGFRWNGKWSRTINKLNGTVEDRAGEMGNLLLKAGFIIQIDNESAREKAISGNYGHEQKRWIAARVEGKYKGYFALSWEYGNQKIYDASRSIAGSRWSKPSVVIPAAQYEAVLDLADEFGFRLSEGAEELVESAKKTKESALVVKPGDAPEPVKEVKSIPGEIDDELRDDN